MKQETQDLVWPIYPNGYRCPADSQGAHTFEPLTTVDLKAHNRTPYRTVTQFYCARCLVQVDEDGVTTHAPGTNDYDRTVSGEPAENWEQPPKLSLRQ